MKKASNHSRKVWQNQAGMTGKRYKTINVIRLKRGKCPTKRLRPQAKRALAKACSRDIRLVREFLQGGKDKQVIAWEALYNHAVLRVSSYVKSVDLRGFDLAQEDVVSEAFARVMTVERMKKYNGTVMFSEYIKGYAENIIKEAWGRKAKENAISYDGEWEKKEVQGQNVIDYAIYLSHKSYTNKKTPEQKRIAEIVTKAFSQLSPKHQKVLELRHKLLGNSRNDIAQEMGIINANAVGCLLCRARIEFKKNLRALGVNFDHVIVPEKKPIEKQEQPDSFWTVVYDPAQEALCA